MSEENRSIAQSGAEKKSDVHLGEERRRIGPSDEERSVAQSGKEKRTVA